MTQRKEAPSNSPKWWRFGQAPAWARSRGWGAWQYSLTFGIWLGILLWLGGTVISLMSGELSWSEVIADPREVRDDLIYSFTAGLIAGGVIFLIERQRWNGEAQTARADSGTGKSRFLVENTFPVKGRGVFVVQGSILSGAVQQGQRVTAPAGIDAPVEAIELVLVSATESREVPGLTFRYRNADELARWEALDLKGQALELEAPTGPENAH